MSLVDNILVTKPGPFHVAPGRIIPWDVYELINYPAADEASTRPFPIIFDSRKRQEWLQRMTLDTSNPQSLKINDEKYGVTLPRRSMYGVADACASTPANLMLDTFLAVVVAIFLIFVICKGQFSKLS